MCGICGMATIDPRATPDGDLLGRMNALLAHRGPDSDGAHTGPGIGLAVRRLSIIDLEHGDQPIANEDGSVVVVCNGEIYNHVELRRELQGLGHTFRGGSDVEVIVHLYEERGLDCLQRLRGMFAFGLWDGRRRRLFLARDRMGIKPLVYAETPGALLFASEAKAILAAPGVPRELNPAALADLVTSHSVFGEKTIFRAVRSLLPAHYLLFEAGRLSTRRYWDLPLSDESREGRITPGEAAGTVRDLLRESVALHLRSDVEVGAWLSGGIDSSVVTALAREEMGRPPRTYSLGFEHVRHEEISRLKTLSDFPEYGLENARPICRKRDIERLPRAIWTMEDPGMARTAIARDVLSERTAQDVKVVLTGEGSDELFGGYFWFWDRAPGWALAERLPRPLRQAAAWAIAHRGPSRWRSRHAARLAAPARMGVQRYLATMDGGKYRPNFGAVAPALRGEVIRAVREREDLATPPGFAASHPKDQLQYYEWNFRMPSFIERDLDLTTMAHGLEARVPFLDHVLVEYVASLPPSIKWAPGPEKLLLRKAVEGIVPPEIQWRRKRGMSAPGHEWLRNAKPDLRALLTPEAMRRFGYFDVRGLPESAHRGTGMAPILMTVLCVHLWHLIFVEGTGWEGIPALRSEKTPA